MSKPFDATLKDLATRRPADFLTTFDEAPALPVQALNVDLSTVTTSGDLVIGVGKPAREVVHIDFQAGPDADKHLDILAYNALLHRKYKVPVHSVLVLRRPKARHPNLTGRVCFAARPRRSKMEFGFEIVRLWKTPAEEILKGPLGTLPLAVLGALPTDTKPVSGLPAVVEQLVARLNKEASVGDRGRLLTSVYILAGLRLSQEAAQQLFQGVHAMEESSTYKHILNEGRGRGRLEGIRGIIFTIGERIHGKASAAIRKKLDSISDTDKLEGILARLLDAKGWPDLLDTP